MKTILAAMMSILAAQAYAQAPLEADLDGNASALQASEMRPQPKSGKQADRQQIARR